MIVTGEVFKVAPFRETLAAAGGPTRCTMSGKRSRTKPGTGRGDGRFLPGNTHICV